jgi:hypothetical protein
MVAYGGMHASILISTNLALIIQCTCSLPIRIPKIVVFLSQFDPGDSFVGFIFL